MKHSQLKFQKGFRVSVGNRKSQAAVMVLAPGGSEGGPNNSHRGADQWLIVTEGSGAAIVNGRRLPLKAGTVVLVEKGDTHEIRNTGRRPAENGQRISSTRVRCGRRGAAEWAGITIPKYPTHMAGAASWVGSASGNPSAWS